LFAPGAISAPQFAQNAMRFLQGEAVQPLPRMGADIITKHLREAIRGKSNF
jgi:hypothetical protein